MKKALVLAAITAGCVGFGSARAQAPVTVHPVDVVAARQAGMGGLYGTWRALRVAVETKAEPKNYRLAVKGLIAYGKQIPTLFPVAAGTGRLGLPAMIEDHAGFEQAAAAMVTAGEALLKITETNDVEAFPAAVKAVSDTCGGCHPRKYAKNWNE